MWLIEHLRSNKCGLFNELSQNLSHSQLKTVLKCKVNVASWKSDSFSVNKLHSNGSFRNDDPSYERLHILCPRWVRDVKLLHDSGHQRFKRFSIFKNTLISPHLVNKELKLISAFRDMVAPLILCLLSIFAGERRKQDIVRESLVARPSGMAYEGAFLALQR